MYVINNNLVLTQETEKHSDHTENDTTIIKIFDNEVRFYRAYIHIHIQYQVTDCILALLNTYYVE